jgi:hypothetical protein
VAQTLHLAHTQLLQLVAEAVVFTIVVLALTVVMVALEVAEAVLLVAQLAVELLHQLKVIMVGLVALMVAETHLVAVVEQAQSVEMRLL